MTDSILTRYYGHVDAGDDAGALALVADDAALSMTIFDSTTQGEGKQAFVDYLAGRGAVSRTHEVARVQVDGDVEFVAGAVVNEDDSVPGYFLAAATVRDGLIVRYQVIMDATFQLAPRPGL
ncbi:nuclear transport factor 2 family protein [Aeromicrobium alkaliterrae]|uniref:SnoaL-like domain-containing protein n=1 Tax=Aeromicrobium alkaliterrae TaxID=302168 RepID=A0ABN2JEQ6_9ACTN